MKNLLSYGRLVMALIMIPAIAGAQLPTMQYYRPDDQRGLHVFETTKEDSSEFTGIKVKLGGSFAQNFQALSHENTAKEVLVNGKNVNELVKLKNGFSLAMANFNINAQLADGIRMNLTTYLSSRHHREAWVKGGYIQFDKLPFINHKLVNKIMENTTIKVGHFELDYGDQHYRRTDGGNAMYNPFVENYLMDAFTTEIGGEVYYIRNGFIVMGGITNGELNPNVKAATAKDTITGETNKYAPAFHGKVGYDKQINNDLRVRLTASAYAVKSAAQNTIFWGDRTGSHYSLVMENTAAVADAQAWSGRFNPSFRQQVQTFVVNPFAKWKGLEFFGTYELAKGRNINETKLREATQLAGELIYRFPAEKESFWIGARYNNVDAAIPGNSTNVNITRMTGSLGWFVTKNIVMKAEYVDQKYNNYDEKNILNGGKMNGFMVQAAVGF